MSNIPLYESPATVNDATPRFRLGQLADYVDATYGPQVLKYVQFKDAVTYAAGHVCTYVSGGAGLTVTNDRSGGSTTGQGVAGISLGTHTQNYYGWVVVEGVCSVKTDTGVAFDDFLVAHTVDGEADTMADGEEEQVFGYALAADVSDAVVAKVRCH